MELANFPAMGRVSPKISSIQILPPLPPKHAHSCLNSNPLGKWLCLRPPNPSALHSSKRSISPKKFLSVTHCTRTPGDGEGDGRPLETVVKLYAAIKDKNLRDMSDLIGEECHCVCNFIPFLGPFKGKKQVLELFSSLMRLMGDHVEFVIKPTSHGGMDVGVAWRLEWQKNHKPLGQGYSFYTAHVYHGKMFIRNLEMKIEPLIFVEHLRLKLMAFLKPIIDQIASVDNHDEKGRSALMYLLILLLFMPISFVLMKKKTL